MNLTRKILATAWIVLIVGSYLLGMFTGNEIAFRVMVFSLFVGFAGSMLDILWNYI